MATTTPFRPASIKLVALASVIGTTIEWYDFFLYGTAAALVLNKLFFPTFDPLAGTLASLATSAVGFVARPIGGIVIGHYGDRIGRKSMLVLTLVIMGVATFLIGLLPTYATLGPMAAVLLVLLRLAQGFGVGGEWGGAVLMAVEHAPAGKRGFYGSWPQIGVPAGLLLATVVYFPFSRMPEADFLSWGWRVPFLGSILLVALGLIIRIRILETPAFARVKEAGQESRQPIIEVLRRYPKEVLLAMGARLAENGAFYVYTTFVYVYATQHVHMDRNIVLKALIISATIELAAIPLFGALSDRVGRRPVYLFGAVSTALLAYPLFWALDAASPPLILLGLLMSLILGHAAMYAPQGAFFSELFGTRVRYSGASLGVQLSSVLAGGLSPIIATRLLQLGYGRGALSLYLIGMAAITIVSVILATETLHHDIDRTENVANFS
jgi:MFS transporter, MHS family, shikimate and dehydroshikimate transport protein